MCESKILMMGFIHNCKLNDPHVNSKIMTKNKKLLDWFRWNLHNTAEFYEIKRRGCAIMTTYCKHMVSIFSYYIPVILEIYIFYSYYNVMWWVSEETKIFLELVKRHLNILSRRCRTWLDIIVHHSIHQFGPISVLLIYM